MITIRPTLLWRRGTTLRAVRGVSTTRSPDAWSARGRPVETRTPGRHEDVLKAGGPSGPYRGEVPHLATDRPGRGGPDLSPTPVYYLRLRRRLSRNSSLLSTRHSRDNHVPNRTLGAPLQQVPNWTATPGRRHKKGEANPAEFETSMHAACRGHETGTLMPTTPNLIRFMNAQHGANDGPRDTRTRSSQGPQFRFCRAFLRNLPCLHADAARGRRHTPCAAHATTTEGPRL